MKKEKEFYAFISYKREDEKWAKWLQDKLEHYRFPTNLNARTDLPKNIRPTFRDVTDLNPGLLAEEINNALHNSEWLIVICSPRSAKSPWVCKEAQMFIDLGRADHIIPFVIEGNPFSDDISTECYPEALLNLTGSNELLAANINEMGRDAAAIKVVARMFSLRFDALWQRYEREQRRKRWMWIGGLIIIALLGLCIGGYFVRQNSIIERQNERLLQDAIIMANHLLKIQNDSILLSVQNDSIALQNYLILSQRDSIEHSMQQLQLSNKLLADERDNVLKINEALKLQNARIRSENALSLLREGNFVGAKDVISQICSDDYAKTLVQVPEIEFTLRKVYRELTREGIRHLYYLDDLGEVSLVKFSKSGNKIYVITNWLSEYDTTSGNLIAQVDIDFETNRDDDIYISAFDEVNGEVYYSIDNKVYVKKVYSVVNDKRKFEFPEHIYDMIVSPTFDYIACEFTNDVDCQSEWRIIDLSDKLNNDYVIPSCENIYCFSPDGKKIFTEIDDKYCIYNLNTKNIEKIVAYDDYIRVAHFSNDSSKIFIQSEDNDKISLDVYNIESGELVEFGKKISGDLSSICRLKENPLQNRIIVGDYYGNLKVYDTEFLSYYNIVKNKIRISGRQIDNLSGHKEAVRLIEFNNNGTKMLTVSKGKICVWDVAIKDELSKYTNQADYIASSGRSYIKINNRTARLYDMTSNKAIGNPLFVNDYESYSRYRIKHISRNNEIVVATKDSSVCVFWPNKKQFFTIPFGCYEYSLELSIDQEGKKLAIYDALNGNKNNSSMKIFDLNNNTLLARDETVHCQAMALNPKGDELAVSSGKDICIYNATSLVRKKELPRMHTDGISSLCYSSDGKYLISVSWDRKVCMWDTQKGELVNTFNGAERELWSCSVSSDNAYISASTGRDSKSKIMTYIWSVGTGEIVEVIEGEDKLLFCQDVSNKIVSTPLANNYFCSFPSLSELISFFNMK